MGKLSKGVILCTIDIVGLYPNIPHAEGLASFRMLLNAKKEKKVTSEILVELAKVAKTSKKQLRGTEVETKFAPPYVIQFMAGLGERH